MSAGSEILIQIKDKNLSIVEVPINVRYDIEDTSTQNPVTHGVLVLYKIIQMISYRRPLPIFGIPGIILVIIGFLFGSWAITEYYSTSTFPFVLTMVGGVFVMTGLVTSHRSINSELFSDICGRTENIKVFSLKNIPRRSKNG